MYTTRVPRPRALRPRHSVVSQWDVLLPLGIAPPDPETDATEMPEILPRRRRSRAGSPKPASGRRSHRHRARQRGQSVPPLAVGVVRRIWCAGWRRRIRQRRIILTSGPSDAGAAAAHRDGGARARLAADEREAVVECGEFDLAELRALIGRAALYIGGDSGPLHIAGTTGVPVVGLYGPTLPVRSQPYRSASLYQRRGGSAWTAVPAMQPAALRARRLPVFERNFG